MSASSLVLRLARSRPLALGLLAFAAGAFAEDDPVRLPAGTLAQVGAIDTLLAGNYDGTAPLAGLTRFGDFGVGTFDRIDGEMVVLDGVIYQVLGTGAVIRADLAGSTPFAAVCHFQGKALPGELRAIDFAALQRTIDAAYPAESVPLALRVNGRFTLVRTRSVPAQQRPYRLLAEVTRAQVEFEAKNVTGTLLGFRLPAFVKGLEHARLPPAFHQRRPVLRRPRARLRGRRRCRAGSGTPQSFRRAASRPARLRRAPPRQTQQTQPAQP